MGDPTTSSDRRLLLERLLRERVARDAAEAPSPGRSYAERVNPQLARLLAGTGLDRRYVRGQGSWLWDEGGDRYLDFTGAYGALPFGHNPAEIWSAVSGVGESTEPIFVQPSVLGAAGELAERLVALAPSGLDRVTFANSGAEAIEVALKVARSATGRLPILTTDNAFHGKTLGALSATGRTQYQRDFGAPVPGFARIPFGDLPALADALGARAEGTEQFAAFVLEPIQGEGGVHEPPAGYLSAASRLCAQFGVLLVLDEVQTGLGRTGRLFACQHEGVVPDIMTLAKALGGGVVPAAAALCRADLVTEGFALRHSSTFAGNALACRVGLRTLDLLTRDDHALVQHVARTGDRLHAGLRALRDRYPSVVTAVRGKGFFLGLELTDDINAFGSQGLVGSLADQENLAMIVCSYLLNAERVRLAPTLFGARVLRVEPPLTATDEECDMLLAALGRALALVAGNDAPALLAPLAGRPVPDQVMAPPAPGAETARAAVAVPARGGDRRFAFVVHPLNLDSFVDFDPGFAGYRHAELEALVRRFDAASSVLNPAPFLVGSGRIESDAGAAAHCEVIGLPYPAAHLLGLPGGRATRVVREAVELARDRGAALVGLGAYSSIVTGNARHLSDVGVPLTTGNAFTVSSAVTAIQRAAQLRGLDLGRASVAVVGAGGAIGRAAARLLARHAGRLSLVGNPAHGEASLERLRQRAREIAATVGDHPADGPLASLDGGGDPGMRLADWLRSGLLQLTVDADEAVASADIVVAATSTPYPVVRSELLRPGAIVCDIAQPPNVPPDTLAERPDVLLFDGGIIRMPGGRGLGVRYGLPEGLTYACMAETMLLALAGELDHASFGEALSDTAILRLSELADEHGFELAAIQTWRSQHHPTEQPGRDLVMAS